MSKTFHFVAISKLTLEHEQEAPASQVKTTDLRLEVSSNLDKDIYFDGKGLPRKAALKPTTCALVSGLVANVRLGVAKGWWKEAEHMEYIIKMLSEMYAHPESELYEGTMEY